ncbi:uncharacterized protein EV422DRAFT_608825 [Fimicolochytrium jonesii]|uniref:uncharacterized protein n=1 Tax=Fimicolochytrium jonesii TaxID=1396493 RepID=UPI0022FDBD2B|nr:uncharacterized protein EV422DRAFT_608825 [Fimicolochytrium jonesii]KAI8823951.1 hypothetical protein EV422DRAFT_608825 [Fimicolochytrium jonesii]
MSIPRSPSTPVTVDTTTSGDPTVPLDASDKLPSSSALSQGDVSVSRAQERVIATQRAEAEKARRIQERALAAEEKRRQQQEAFNRRAEKRAAAAAAQQAADEEAITVRRRQTWTTEESLALCELYRAAKAHVVSVFSGTTFNATYTQQVIREYIKRQWVDHELSRRWTVRQAENRWHNIQSQYKKAKDELAETGGGGLGAYKERFPWWDVVEEEGHGTAAVVPLYVLQGSRTTGASEAGREGGEEGGNYGEDESHPLDADADTHESSDAGYAGASSPALGLFGSRRDSQTSSPGLGSFGSRRDSHQTSPVSDTAMQTPLSVRRSPSVFSACSAPPKSLRGLSRARETLMQTESVMETLLVTVARLQQEHLARMEERRREDMAIQAERDERRRQEDIQRQEQAEQRLHQLLLAIVSQRPSS